MRAKIAGPHSVNVVEVEDRSKLVCALPDRAFCRVPVPFLLQYPPGVHIRRFPANGAACGAGMCEFILYLCGKC